MKSYYVLMSDGKKTHFQCEPKDLQKWVSDLTRIYSKRGLKVLSGPKES